MAEAVQAKLGLVGVAVAAVVALILLVGGVLIFWALGLLVAVSFAVIGFMFLYALDKSAMLDVAENKWLLAVPLLMFLCGFAADYVGVLSVQPLSVSDPASAPVTLALLVVIVCLLIVDIAVGLRD